MGYGEWPEVLLNCFRPAWGLMWHHRTCHLGHSANSEFRNTILVVSTNSTHVQVLLVLIDLHNVSLAMLTDSLVMPSCLHWSVWSAGVCQSAATAGWLLVWSQAAKAAWPALN